MTTLKTALKLTTFSKLLHDEGLTKKAYLNALAAALDYGARLLVGFILTPFLVAGLGDYLYGTWRILERMTTYLSAASGRPTQALKWTIANKQASTDYAEKRRNVGSAGVVWLLFLPLLITIGGAVAWLLPYLLHAPPDLIWSIRLAAAILVLNLIVFNLADVPRSVLEGENLGYKRMGLSATTVLIGGGLTGVALYFETGIVGVAIASLSNTVLTGLLFLYVVRSYVPWFGIARSSLREIRRFFGLSGWFLAWRLVMQLIMASDVILLGLLASVETVTIYTLTRYVPETLTNLVALVVFGIIPGLGGIIGAGDLKKAVQVRNEIMLLTWLIVTVIGTTILLWNRTFIALWVGAEYYAGPIPTLVIMLMVTQFVLIRNDANIIDLTLNLQRKVLLGTVSVTISLLLASILVGYFNMGVVGLCLGFMAGRAMLSLGYPGIVSRFLGLSLFSQFRGILKPGLVMLIFFAGAAILSEFVIISTWLGLIFSVGVSLATVSLLAFFTGLSGSQRVQLRQRAQRVLHVD